MRRPSLRGFTLIEMAVVVIIIGVFATMAMPQITRQLRDRRTHEMAQRIALAYQQARMRAMGQGGAMLVRFTDAGTIETQEALVGKVVDTLESCDRMPSVSCTRTDWDNAASKQFRSIEVIDIAKQPGLDNVTTVLTTETGTSGTTMDVCFTPLGRTFIRYGVADPWHTPVGVPQIGISRVNGTVQEGLMRKVLVLPTGLARLQL